MVCGEINCSIIPFLHPLIEVHRWHGVDPACAALGLKAGKYREQTVSPAPGRNPCEDGENMQTEIWMQDVLAVRRQC